MSTAGAKPAATPVDPFLRTDVENVYDRALKALDTLALDIQEEASAMGFDVTVERSAPAHFPLFAKFEAWVPSQDKRALKVVSMSVELKLNPYLQHDISFVVTFQRAGKRQHKSQVNYLDRHFVAVWIRYLFESGPPPSEIGFYQTYIEPALSRLVTTLTFGRLRLDPNPMRAEFRGQTVTPFLVLTSLSALSFLIFYFTMGSYTSSYWFFLFGIGFAVAAVVANRLEKVLLVVSAIPAFEPRQPRLVDTWHASVPDMGTGAAEIKSSIVDAIRDHYRDQVQIAEEIYRYRGTRTFVERPQSVFLLNQALVFLQCYNIGGDLFVGWDASLNLARWQRSTPLAKPTINAQTWQLCMPLPSPYQPNEYDLVDVSAISETIHSNVRRILEREMKARALVAEIDFEIVRGDRANAIRKDEQKSRLPLFRRALQAPRES